MKSSIPILRISEIYGAAQQAKGMPPKGKIYRDGMLSLDRYKPGIVRGDMVPVNIEEAFARLFDRDNSVAYQALQELQKESEKADGVYPYLDRLSSMLDNANSYIRTRGIVLIAYQAKWDREHKIDNIIDRYLKHITDSKPIAARQCIKSLPMLAKHKPELRDGIRSALHQADLSGYPDSMRALVSKDIQKALQEI